MSNHNMSEIWKLSSLINILKLIKYSSHIKKSYGRKEIDNSNFAYI